MPSIVGKVLLACRRTRIGFVMSVAHKEELLKAEGPRNRLFKLAGEPASRVANIGLNIVQRLRIALVTVAGRLSNEARATHFGVPVVIRKVVKA